MNSIYEGSRRSITHTDEHKPALIRSASITQRILIETLISQLVASGAIDEGAFWMQAADTADEQVLAMEKTLSRAIGSRVNLKDILGENANEPT